MHMQFYLFSSRNKPKFHRA